MKKRLLGAFCSLLLMLGVLVASVVGAGAAHATTLAWTDTGHSYTYFGYVDYNTTIYAPDSEDAVVVGIETDGKSYGTGDVAGMVAPDYLTALVNAYGPIGDFPASATCAAVGGCEVIMEDDGPYDSGTSLNTYSDTAYYTADKTPDQLVDFNGGSYTPPAVLAPCDSPGSYTAGAETTGTHPYPIYGVIATVVAHTPILCDGDVPQGGTYLEMVNSHGGTIKWGFKYDNSRLTAGPGGTPCLTLWTEMHEDSTADDYQVYYDGSITGLPACITEGDSLDMTIIPDSSGHFELGVSGIFGESSGGKTVFISPFTDGSNWGSDDGVQLRAVGYPHFATKDLAGPNDAPTYFTGIGFNTADNGASIHPISPACDEDGDYVMTQFNDNPSYWGVTGGDAPNCGEVTVYTETSQNG